MLTSKTTWNLISWGNGDFGRYSRGKILEKALKVTGSKLNMRNSQFISLFKSHNPLFLIHLECLTMFTVITDEILVKTVGYGVQPALTAYSRLSGLSIAHIRFSQHRRPGGREPQAGFWWVPLPGDILPASPGVLCGESTEGTSSFSLSWHCFSTKSFWGSIFCCSLQIM